MNYSLQGKWYSLSYSLLNSLYHIVYDRQWISLWWTSVCYSIIYRNKLHSSWTGLPNRNNVVSLTMTPSNRFKVESTWSSHSNEAAWIIRNNEATIIRTKYTAGSLYRRCLTLAPITLHFSFNGLLVLLPAVNELFNGVHRLYRRIRHRVKNIAIKTKLYQSQRQV